VVILSSSNVIYGPQAQKELVRAQAADPEWARVIRLPLFPQVIEDLAKDCCNNANQYRSRKRKGYRKG